MSFKNTWVQRTVLCITVCFFLVASVTIAPKHAEATWPVVVTNPDIIAETANTSAQSTVSAVKNTISAAMESISSAMLRSLELKEWTLDGIAFALAKRLLSEMARSTVNWINSGFQGTPMFMTDPGAFMLNIADEIAGEAINGSQFSFLCSPINIRVALQFAYQNSSRRKPSQCTVTGVIGNVQSFIQGNFAAGGWPGWLSVSLDPKNTTLGGGILAQAQLEAAIYSRQGTAQMTAGWGNGFLSREECTGGDTESGNAGGATQSNSGPRVCRTVTPGTTIADALTFEIQGTERSLIEADEINEIIGALIGQALRQGITAAQGIFTKSQSSGGGSAAAYNSIGYDDPNNPCDQLSYIEQANIPECNPMYTQYASADTTTASGKGSVTAAINDEGTYQSMQQRIVDAATSIKSEAVSRGASCGINNGIVAEMDSHIASANAAIATSKASVVELQNMQKDVEGTNEDAKLQALTKLGAMQQSGAIHTSITNATLKEEIDNKVAAINRYRTGLDYLGLPDPNQTIIRDCPASNTNTNVDTNNGSPTEPSGG